MGDDTGKPPPPERARAVLTADQVRAVIARAPRCRVSVAVVCRPSGTADRTGVGAAIDAELVNVSASGMLLASARPLAVGTTVEFAFKLDDGVVALSGSAEVARASDEAGVVGMGLRFVTLDQAGRDLVARLVDASAAAPELPAAGAAPAPVEYEHGRVRVRLSPATARFFTYNPLLHVGIGGCFLPASDDVPLGAGYQLDVLAGDRLLLRCKAKVAAKQDRRIGLRFVDVDRAALRTLRAAIDELAAEPAPGG